MKKKSIVMLSGGLDSVINFKKAYDETEISFILTFNYGQEASGKEIEASGKIAEKYGLKHEVIKLDFMNNINLNLTKGSIPEFDANRINDPEYTVQTAKAVWVPNRNGIMINIAGAYADKYRIDYIITGFNREEGTTFPDNTPEFIENINNSLSFSTIYNPRVLSYTINMDKTEIVRFGISIDAPFEFIWSCYHGESRMCGKCESCQRLIRALENNSFTDIFKAKNHWSFKTKTNTGDL